MDIVARASLVTLVTLHYIMYPHCSSSVHFNSDEFQSPFKTENPPLLLCLPQWPINDRKTRGGKVGGKRICHFDTHFGDKSRAGMDSFPCFLQQ